MAIGQRTAVIEGKTDTAVTTHTLTKPTGLANGDVVYVGVTCNGGSTPTAPSGFVNIATIVTQTNPRVYGYRKVITDAAGEGAWTFTIGLITAGFVCQAFTGVDSASPEDTSVNTASNSTGSNAITVTGVTTVTDGAVLLYFMGVNSSTQTLTAPSGMTEIGEGGARKSEMDYELRATAGATGDRTGASSSSTTAWAAFMFGIRPASGGGGGGVYTPRISNWRWYTDAATDAGMTALAAENVTPTLSGAQTMGGILRLRVQLAEIGGVGGTPSGLTVEYGVDGSNWTEVPPQTGSGVSNWQNRHVRWANGARTDAAALDGTILTGSTTGGGYRESQFTPAALSANEVREYDFAFKMIWPMPDTTYKIRILSGGTPITNSGSEIRFTACTAAQRLYTVDKADTATNASQNREVNHSAWPRMFFDGSTWWTFVTQPMTATNSLFYYYNALPNANPWTKASVNTTVNIVSTSEADVKHAPWMRRVGSTPVVGVGLYPSSGNMRYMRGYASGTTITWNANVDLGVARPGTQSHACIDQGGFHWMAGINGTTGVWARRSTAADDGSTTYSPTFGGQLSLADSGVAAGNILALCPIASNRVLAVWRNGSVLKAAEVTGAGFGTATQVNSTASAHPDDWGVGFDGTYVYVVHSDSTAVGGTWRTRVYPIATSTWANGVDPGITGQISNADGIVVSALATTGIAVFGTDVGTEGGQDRTIQAKTYTGGTGGTWGSKVVITPAGGRGNGDDIAGPPNAGGGIIPILYLFGDCDTNGVPYAYEAHTLAVSGGVTKARPSADVATGLWQTNSGGLTSLYTAVDEVVADDNDYVQSGASPTTADVWEVSLSSLTDPVVHTGHNISIRVGKDAAAGDQINLTVTLLQGASTQIAVWTIPDLPPSLTAYSFDLTTTEAALITDYTTLRLRFAAVKV